MSQAADLRLPGTGYAALQFGPEDGPRVLALHGWLDNAASFGPLAAHLPGLRIVAVDLPGHGHSEHRGAASSLMIVEYVGEILRMADALRWETFALLGHSLGATVAGLVAATAPERITALALIEGLAPLTAQAADAPRRLAEHVQAVKAPRRPPPIYANESEALAARVKAGEFARPEAMLPVVRRGLKAIPGGVTWRADPRVKLPSPLRLTPELAEAFLAKIAAPVVFVQASKGLPIKEPALLDRQKAAVPRLTVVELPGYHHLHLDDPAPVAAAIGPLLGAR
jgi:pimeloyl-ACP methyl ester carboxylesterase